MDTCFAGWHSPAVYRSGIEEERKEKIQKTPPRNASIEDIVKT